MKSLSAALLISLAVPAVALAQSPFDSMRKAAGSTAKGAVEKRVNAKLTEEARKNQCSFKSGTDQLAAGCERKLQDLTGSLVEAKKQLDGAGIRNYRFEVSGHTDSTGDAAKNKALSQKRAAVIVKELTARGIPTSEIIAVGLGSERMLVKPDDTEAKRAQNRRYEIQVRL